MIDKALLDLRASVNLLSYSVYKQLDLRDETNSGSIIFGRSFCKCPRGIVEDVLIKIDKFIFSVDFIILDTEIVPNSSNHVPVILGQ